MVYRNKASKERVNNKEKNLNHIFYISSFYIIPEAVFRNFAPGSYFFTPSPTSKKNYFTFST